MHHWFGEYLEVLAACCRGERDTDALLGYFGVPLLLTTGGGYFGSPGFNPAPAARKTARKPAYRS